MAIEYNIQVQGLVLIVIAKGTDETFEQAATYSAAVIEAAISSRCKKILCDERQLDYHLSTFETFNLAEYAAQYAKHVVKIAIVCNSKHLNDGKFYETVSRNRGMIIRVTSDFEEAKLWLEM